MDVHLTKALEIVIGIIILAAGLGYLLQLGGRMDAVMKASVDYHNTDLHYTSLQGGSSSFVTDSIVGVDELYYQLVELKDITVWIDSNAVDTLTQWHKKNEGSGVHEGAAVIKQYLDGLTSDRFHMTLVVDSDDRIIGMNYTSIP